MEKARGRKRNESQRQVPHESNHQRDYANQIGLPVVSSVGKPLLLLRPFQGEDEGFPAHITRLCSVNRIGGAGALARRLGLTYGQMIQLGPEKFRNVICGKSGIAIERPGSAVRGPVGRESNLNGVCTKTRICPTCLKEGRFCPEDWDWPLSLVCERHSILLVDSCPRCGAPVSHLRNHQLKCKCGQDYRRCIATEVPAWVATFHRVFAPWRGDDAVGSIELIRKENESLLIIRGLIATPSKKTDSIGRRSVGPNNALLRTHNCDALTGLMEKWPEAFLLYVAELYRSAPRHTVALLKRMLHLNSPDLTCAAKEALGTIAAEMKKNSDELKQRDPIIRSVSDICRITRLNPQTIVKLIARKELTAKVVKQNKFRRIEMTADDANRLREFYESTFDLTEAAERLGCTELHVNLFSRAAALSPTKVTAHSNTWRFTEADLDYFRSTILALARDSSASEESLIPLGELPVKNNYGFPVKSSIRLANRIVSGEVPLFKLEGSGDGLALVAIRASDIPHARGKRS